MDEDKMDLINTQFQTINSQFKQVNDKLDKLGTLIQQTNLQEYRIQQLEEALDDIVKNKKDVFWKYASPAISSLISAVVAYIIAGGLVK